MDFNREQWKELAVELQKLQSLMQQSLKQIEVLNQTQIGKLEPDGKLEDWIVELSYIEDTISGYFGHTIINEHEVTQEQLESDTYELVFLGELLDKEPTS
jgi:hypothetical protein